MGKSTRERAAADSVVGRACSSGQRGWLVISEGLIKCVLASVLGERGS